MLQAADIFWVLLGQALMLFSTRLQELLGIVLALLGF